MNDPPPPPRNPKTNSLGKEEVDIITVVLANILAVMLYTEGRAKPGRSQRMPQPEENGI